MYIGLTSETFKSRYNGHTETFRNKEGKSTALSSHIWNLEESYKYYEIKWSIKKKAKTYMPGSSFCDLCNSEKLAILLADPEKALNKRSEILEMCRHRFPFKLKNYLT